LRSFGDHSGYLAETAAQVYERIDGSGYPRGLRGDEIHEYAQIIGLLDMYEALIHSRPQRDKVTPFTAIKEVINTSKHRFQRKHLKSLLSIFTLFPIHSYVRLNSNAIGRVIETCADQPMRPKLQILYDSQRQKVLSERIVILPDNPLLNIVDSVSESEIQELSKS
jgi:HD-GYP domain-containing protein (c-di-GMP phosphodiesterase class II)